MLSPYKLIPIKYLTTYKLFPHLPLQNFALPCPTTTRYNSEDGNKCERIQTNTPHPPRDPPQSEPYNPISFKHCAFDKPKNVQPLVFRPMQGYEVLGPNASKKKVYKNPEYYAYHRYSHVDLFMNAMRIRKEKELQLNCCSPEEDLEECEDDEESDDDENCKEEENNHRGNGSNADDCERKGDVKKDNSKKK
ncbi:uncharacterized protein LOC129952386 [Eupeodes corollae]|uniref:uncharacterized protein LOC129952386 n=1 Tax=Eupeodes corollae TaxID=290404 RepID=UPI002491438E|nr:uncharacterized protein LOC129952386 [Eupeodes corollae]